MSVPEMINYLELPCRNLSATKAFFSNVFAWDFTDYGEEYAAFSKEKAGLDGGFYQADLAASANQGSALVVFLSTDLEATQAKIEAAGGVICHPIFAFPGGRRFHFQEPSGNEFAVWSKESPAT